ncbi:peptide chain release factor N(5)-glutamine methyltransferase [Streptococcus fryi]
MTYAEVLAKLGQQLEELGEERLALELAFRHVKGWSKTEFVLQQRTQPTIDDELLLNSLYEQLSAHIPYQYIIGKAEFGELILTVDKRVLIPRPETEELVALILSENPSKELSVLDIGTGSGAIALSLKHQRPMWQITASDVSRDALDVAEENAVQNKLDVTFVQSDVFENITGRYDIIVSNPPYIAYDDKDEVGLNVLSSEPHLALFADEDGYQIYRRIMEDVSSYLTPKGKLYFEIGYKQGEIMKQFTQTYFPNKRVRVIVDSFGKDRMVVIDD